MSTTKATTPTPLAYLVLSGSSRSGSYNTALARQVGEEVVTLGGTSTLRTIADYEMPHYTHELEARRFPESARALREDVRDADGVILTSPEFNASVPGAVKNVIDWLSRFRPQPFNEKQLLLMSASPSMVGGNRGLWALRIPLEHLGARVYPDMFSLAQAHHAFGEGGRISNPELTKRLRTTVSAFMALTEAATRYRCSQHIWSEFPGEASDSPVVARRE